MALLDEVLILFPILAETSQPDRASSSGHDSDRKSRAAACGAAFAQIFLVDMVFSLDSVITAVGMVEDLRVMVAAILISVAIMMLAAGSVSAFVDRHPTVKMLALSFLLLIGCTPVAEGWSFDVPKGYVYFAMAFSVFVEMLNIRATAARRRREEAAY
jgi:predicted tellurium resistance membrane protein TerC